MNVRNRVFFLVTVLLIAAVIKSSSGVEEKITAKEDDYVKASRTTFDRDDIGDNHRWPWRGWSSRESKRKRRSIAENADESFSFD